MSRGMIKAPIFLPPMGHGFGGGMPMMPPLPGGPPQMPNMPPGPPRQPTPQNAQEGGFGSPAVGGAPGQVPFQGVPGQAPFQALPGQVPFQGVPGQAPFQALPGQIPFQGVPGQAPFQAGPSPMVAGPGLGFAPAVPFHGAPAFQAGMGLPFPSGLPGQFQLPAAPTDFLAQQEPANAPQAAVAEPASLAAPEESGQRRQFRRPGMYSTRQANLQFTART